MAQTAHDRPDVVVRILQPADLAFADSLRALAGWNQTLKDWQRLLSFAPEGCFVAEWQGKPAGTVTSIRYGPELGWIGMLLVHPARRRCGIGSALLGRGLEHLANAGVRCVRLDATPAGKPLYERFGFQPEWSLTRWENAGCAVPGSGAPRTELRAVSAADLDLIVGLDARAFGIGRRQVFEGLLDGCLGTALHLSSNGQALAYGLLREGCRAAYLGPVVAPSVDAATAIVGHLLRPFPGKPVFWDVPDSNQPARALAQALGFKAQRQLLRMRRGDSGTTGDSLLQFAILDPALG